MMVWSEVSRRGGLDLIGKDTDKERHSGSGSVGFCPVAGASRNDHQGSIPVLNPPKKKVDLLLLGDAGNLLRSTVLPLMFVMLCSIRYPGLRLLAAARSPRSSSTRRFAYFHISSQSIPDSPG
jgi:hypothetical protein